MTMIITKAQLDAGYRFLHARPRDRAKRERIDFRVRPVSEEWRLLDRRAAYKTAVANVAYIWRDPSAVDRFGPMPPKFADHRDELHAAGLILPASAPVWATKGYTVWEEADAATVATGDPTAVAAWHVMFELPKDVPASSWHRMVTDFIEQQLAANGAITAWAIHALRDGAGGWLIAPHVHAVVSARHFRHDRRHGRRHPGWIGSTRAQARLENAWRYQWRLARMGRFWIWRRREPGVIDGTAR